MLQTPIPPVVYGIGSRRIYELTNSHTDRVMEYARRFTIDIDTTHADSQPQQTGDDPVGPIPADTEGIPGRDIHLVCQQTGVSIQQALDALRRHDGDIVNSIMDIVENT
jgi:NACalpha-BTF3-like transcription factor